GAHGREAHQHAYRETDVFGLPEDGGLGQQIDTIQQRRGGPAGDRKMHQRGMQRMSAEPQAPHGQAPVPGACDCQMAVSSVRKPITATSAWITITARGCCCFLMWKDKR